MKTETTMTELERLEDKLESARGGGNYGDIETAAANLADFHHQEEIRTLTEHAEHWKKIADRHKTACEDMDARMVSLFHAIGNAADIPIEFDGEARMAVELLAVRAERFKSLLRVIVTDVYAVDCKDIGHEPGDFHSASEDCPIALRVNEALDKAREMLKQEA